MTAPKSPRQSDDTLTGTDIIPAPEEETPGTESPADIREGWAQVARSSVTENPDGGELPGTAFLRREYYGDEESGDPRSLLPQPVTGTIDVAKFLTAQAEYIKAQTVFMQSRRRSPEPPHPEEVLREVTRFSYAQADFIEAQSEVLKNLGVI